MSERCLICRGEQKVRLPLYRSVSMRCEATAEKIDESYRVYPCPECAPTVSESNVRVLEHHFQADSRFEGERGYREHLVGMGASAIAHKIEEGGFMRLQEGKVDRDYLRRGYRMTVGVVAANITAALDAGAIQKQDAFAREVMAIATAEISNWGSYYGHSEILKQDASRLIDAALSIAQRRRPV